MTTTVASRIFRSTPHRDAAATWSAICSLLTRGQNTTAVAELNAVAGVASSVIADAAPKDAPIIVTCDGPRTRIYCIYDDDSLDESSASEDALGFDPLAGDWSISLPCLSVDLSWVKQSLSRLSKRVTARDAAEGIELPEKASASASAPLTLNVEELYK